MDNIYQEFDHYMKMLVGANAEAKDNSKFLNTLERQFKILQSGDLASIEQCLSSLLNGLRLVFIISRYYKQDEKMSKLLTIISNEICDRVREKINIRELLKPQPGHCCVFCSYGSVQCSPIQESWACCSRGSSSPPSPRWSCRVPTAGSSRPRCTPR